MTDTWIPPEDLHAWADEQLAKIAKTVKQAQASLEAHDEDFNRLMTMKSIRDVPAPDDDPLLRAWVLINDIKQEAIDAGIKDAIQGRSHDQYRIEQLNKLRAIIELGLKS